MILLRMFFVFEDLWWKFFGALEAWIRRASLICDLLMFSDLWAWFPQTLGSRQMIWMILLRMFSGFGIEVLEVLEGFWGLIFAELLHFWILVLPNVSGRLLFIGVLGWVSDTWRNLIGDTCHSLIGSLMSSLTRTGLLISSLTRAELLMSLLTHARLLMSSLTHADVWLVFACISCLYFNDTRQISVGFWVVITKPSSSTWRFVIGWILWTSMMCQLVIGREFSLSTNAPSRLVHAHNLGVWCGNEFQKIDFW